jgi:hypothetical protein
MDDTHTFFWLVGLFEGEACFLYNRARRRPAIEVEMKDEHVIARVASLFSLAYTRRDRRLQNPRSQITYRVAVTGARAMSVMKRLQPYLSPRRARTIERIAEQYLSQEHQQKAFDRLTLPSLTEVPYTRTRE